MSNDSNKVRPPSAAEDRAKPGTEAFRTFFLSVVRDSEIYHVTMAFLKWVPHLRAGPSSDEHPQLSKALEELLGTHERLNALRKPDAGPHLLAEVMLSRAVDNFQCYLAEVLTTVFLARPDTLRSSDVVTLEEVLQCASMDEFISRAVERKAEALTYKGVSAIFQFMVDRLGLAINEDDDCIREASEAIAVRNVVVHNRGRVNTHFLRLTGRTDLKSGDLVPIDLDKAKSWADALFNYAVLIDRAVMAKFAREIVEYVVRRKSEA